MKIARLIPLLIVTVITAHVLAPLAAAHPLGNFTINHYAGLRLNRERIDLDFVLDMAEIPAFQEILTFDANANGRPDPSETAAYHAAACQSLRPDLLLRLAGRLLRLELLSSAVEFPPGAGGLPTLRLSCHFQGALPEVIENARFEFSNNVYAERLGWREIVITGDAFALPDELAQSPSRRLTLYPTDQLNNPPNQRQLALTLLPLETSARHSPETAVAHQPAGQPLVERNDGFTQLITLPALTPSAVILALLVAFVWGAGHALTPGHGKTIVAAYLVGSRGTMRHALFLGLTTTITHTAGVFILGFLTLLSSNFIAPEQFYPWLGVASGLLVVAIGLSLFRGQLSGLTGHGAGHNHHDHSHPHDHFHHHHHEDDHPHAHPHPSHSHLPPGADGAPITWRNLLALGISGGLLPCPSALIVMLSAISFQRVGFGLVLILAFSLGLASVLTTIGILWVQARQVFDHLPRPALLKPAARYGRLLRLLPAASALFITIAGIAVAFRAFLQTGLLN